MNRTAWIALLLTLLTGCDRLAERAGMPDPAKVEAEGKAIGAACRNAGRGLEDCFQINDRASKSAIYAGWKEMNEYMLKNSMAAIAPEGDSNSADDKQKQSKDEAKDDAKDADAAAAKDKKAAH